MRILFLGRYVTDDLFRGPEKVARRIADEIAAQGNDVHFYEYFFSGAVFGLREKLFGSVEIGNTAGIDVKRVGILPLLLLLVRRRFDVIHIITFERFAVLALMCKVFRNVKIVYSVHGIVAYEAQLKGEKYSPGLRLKDRICESAFFKCADRLFFLSEQSIDIALRYYTFPKAKTILVANGIDEGFNGAAANARPAHADVSIVFIGEPSRAEKGFAFFRRALARCTEHALVFVICEHVPAQEVEAVNGMTIRYIGKMSGVDYASFLSGMDLYVNASSYEQFSTSAVEAMSSGVVPIVTRETGMSRFIEPGVNGYLVPYGDDRELAGTLDLLIGSASLRRASAAQAMTIREMLLWKNVAKDYISQYPV